MHTTYDKKLKIWKGPQSSFTFNTNAGLGELIISVLRRTPSKIVQINDNNGVSLTCKQLRDQSIRVAENLLKKGYKCGDMMAVASRNNQDISSVIFGCSLIGAPINCLDPTFVVQDLYDLLSVTRPKVVFCEELNLENVNKTLEIAKLNSEVILLGDKLNGFAHITSLYAEIEGLEEDDYIPMSIEHPDKHPAVILCSSGTTGKSKGVCLSHSHIIAQCENICGSTEEDTILCFSSLYWISGYASLVMGTLLGMKRIVTTETFSAELMCNMIEKYKVTTIISPPSQLSQMLQYDNIDNVDLSSVRMYLSGGSFVSDNLRRCMQQRMKNSGIYVGYGLTEIGGLAVATYPFKVLGSVGRLLKRMRAKIVDENTEENLGPDEKGEICFKFEFSFLGYYGEEERTKEAFDKDGWIRSGDIGYVDENGNFFLVDRKKDIIKYKNYQISPSDVESVLQQETGILNMCVVGIEDFENGTDLPAIVIQRDKNLKMTEDDVIKVAEKSLPDYKRLRGGCYFVDELPMTPSGKIQRKITKEIAMKLYQKIKANK